MSIQISLMRGVPYFQNFCPVASAPTTKSISELPVVKSKVHFELLIELSELNIWPLPPS